MKPYEGSRSSRSIAYHRVNAPWPTCSCLECRRARSVAELGDAFDDGIRRMRISRAKIYEELRRLEAQR